MDGERKENLKKAQLLLKENNFKELELLCQELRQKGMVNN